MSKTKWLGQTAFDRVVTSIEQGSKIPETMRRLKITGGDGGEDDCIAQGRCVECNHEHCIHRGAPVDGCREKDAVTDEVFGVTVGSTMDALYGAIAAESQDPFFGYEPDPLLEVGGEMVSEPLRASA